MEGVLNGRGICGIASRSTEPLVDHPGAPTACRAGDWGDVFCRPRQHVDDIAEKQLSVGGVEEAEDDHWR
jgi:hypothetical protein